MTDVRLATLFAVVGAIGFVCLVADLRWFTRLSTAQRLGPFLSTGPHRRTKPTHSGVIAAVLPNFSLVAGWVTRAAGINEALERRLLRARDERSPSVFRARQLTAVIVATALGAFLTLLLKPPAFVSLLFALGAPLLAFLWLEQDLAQKVSRRQRSLMTELPLFAEQLAMLVGAGYSTGAALSRLAQRNAGVIAEELSIVCRRVEQGLTTSDALHEWAEVTNVPQLDRLVAVLSIGSGANDLGRLLSHEATAVREEAHRQLNARIEQRAQQVWIPVTVATLIPGVIFLLIPFTQALSLFSNS